MPVTLSSAPCTRSGLPLFSDSFSFNMAEWWKLLSRRISDASFSRRLASLVTAGSFLISFGTSSSADSARTKFNNPLRNQRG